MVLLMPALLAKTQDPYFSQFYASRVYLNPAYAGFDPGTTVELSYRDQWFGVPDGDVGTFKDSYRTFLADVNMQIPCVFDRENIRFGLGFMALRDEAGNNPLTTNAFSMANSFSVDLQKARGIKAANWTLKFGVQSSLMQKRLDGDFFVYSSQLDPVWGLIGDPLTRSLQSSMFLNLNAGILLRIYSPSKYSQTGNLVTIGGSVFNAAEPNESISDNAGAFSLYRRYNMHLSWTFPWGARTPFVKRYLPVSISFNARFDRQAEGALNMLTIGGYALSKGFYFGAFFQGNLKKFDSNTTAINPYSRNFLTQNTSKIIFNLGFDVINLGKYKRPAYEVFQSLVIGFSYDIGFQGLTQQNTAGVLELQMSANFGRRNRRGCATRPGSFRIYNGECPINF